MSNENPLKHILSCLEGVEEISDGSYKALCPAHDDHEPSLSVTEGEDHKPLVHCFVCKNQEKVWRALEERGISKSDLSKYIYVISAGFEPMIERVRHGHRLYLS